MNPTISQKIAIFAIVILLAGVAFALADSGPRGDKSYDESPGKIYIFGTGGFHPDAERSSGKPAGRAVIVPGPGYGPAFGESPGKIYVYGTGGHTEASQRRDEHLKGYSTIVYTQRCTESPGKIYVHGTGGRTDDDTRKDGKCD